MRKISFLTTAAAIALLNSAVYAAPSAVKLDKPLTFDGKLDEAVWQKAVKFNKFFTHNTTRAAQAGTEVYLLYDNSNIYLGFKCFQDRPAKAKATGRTGKVYSDDSVEMMIDPNATENRYFHFLTNVNGAVSTRKCDQGGHVADSKWKGTVTSKGFQGNGFWSCEVKIPFSTLDILPDSDRWAFGFVRNNYGKATEHSTTSADGSINAAGHFLKVEKFQINHALYAWEIGTPQLNTRKVNDQYKVTLSVPLTNNASIPQNVRTTLAISGNGEATGYTFTREAFEAQKGRTLLTPELKFNKQGKYKLSVTLRDPANGRVLKKSDYPVTISFSPLELAIDKPNYKGLIFESMQLENVVYSVKNNMNDAKNIVVKTGIKDAANQVIFSTTLKGSGKVTVPNSKLPYGKLTVFAEVDDQTRQTIPLRKLEFRKGEVWRDADGFWRIEKERFLPVISWGDCCFEGITAKVNGDKDPKVKTVSGATMWSHFPGRKSLRLARVTPEDEQHMRKAVRKAAASSKLFCHFLADEPEIQGITASALTHTAEIIRDEDPYHPTMVSNDFVSGLKDFADAAALNGLHPYPSVLKNTVRNDFGKVVNFMDQAMIMSASRKEPQIICYLQQGFNYGDCGAVNNRVPTFDEIRTQFIMSLVLGGKGIMFFHFTTPHYPEFYIGNPEIGKEMTALTPVLLSNDYRAKNFKVSSKYIRTLTKKVGNHYWILACSTVKEPVKAEITLPELGSRKLYVWREGRTIAANKGSFSDNFNNFDTHIYTTDSDAKGLRTLQEVEKAIAAANEARRKPGNLAFQMLEGDKLKFRASSNWLGSRVPDCGLWHLTDGVIKEPLASSPNGTYGTIAWKDRTPNKTPDWVELEFPVAVTAGRIVVYPAENTLRDYEVQARINGNWQTLGSAKNAQGKFQEFKFAPVNAKVFRLYITANNGPTSKVHEIEIYEK